MSHVMENYVTTHCIYHNIIIVENTGEFSYLDFLEEKSLVNGLIMANWILKLSKFEGETGDLPTLHQIFSPPLYS